MEMYPFNALLARMKYIARWGLMRAARTESLSEHTADAAILAHTLCLVSQTIFGTDVRPETVAVAALYHDASEILTGDMPTPVKYKSEPLRAAYKAVEADAAHTLGALLPDAVRGVIADSAYTSPRAIWQHVMGKNLHLPVRAATVIADLLCQKRLNASSGSYSTVEALKNTDVPILLIHGEDDHFVPLKMAFENRDACAAPCKLLVVPGADHAMSYYMGRGAYEAAMRAFWEHFDK